MTPPAWGPRTRAAIVALLTLILGAGVTIAVVDNGPDHGPGKPRRTITVTLGGQGRQKVELPPAAQQVARAQAHDDAVGNEQAAEADLHETVSVPPASIDAGNDAAPATQPSIPDVVPQAAPRAPPGCRVAFVRNQSSRNGAKIALGVIHWTGSRNIAGSAADVLGNVKWFDTPAAQASSTYITDDDGNCYYTVPEVAKAWTQAAANPWSLSVEVTNPGVLPLFGSKAGRARVLQLMRRWHRLWGLPYRRAAVNGSCVPTRSGFLAHRDLGACGGGHPDVGPSPATVDALIRDARAGDPGAALARRRAEHVALHRRLRSSCTKAGTARHPVACATLRRRNTALHRQGV